LTDPEHAVAVQILNSTAKRKADKIAKALVFYQKHNGGVSNVIAYEPKPQTQVVQTKPVTSGNDILDCVGDALDAFGIE